MLDSLWTPTVAGKISLPHRLAMAPLTRSRATPDGVPTELNAEYYAQRASHALIITEGTQPSADGQGYPVTPGIYTDEHIAGWRKVTDAVHKADGRIVIQLMHVGRISHPENTPHHRQPVAPSAIKPAGQTFTGSGMQEMPEPRALSTEEVAATVDDFRRAAAAAIAAGADGVEIHGANGYLVHQFLATNTNQRTDQYGGSLDNRIRFAVEVATAVADEIGADRTGIRLSPGNPFQLGDLTEDDPHELYPHLVRALAPPRPRLPAPRPRRRRGTPGHTARAVAPHAAPQPRRHRHRHPRQGHRQRHRRRRHRGLNGPRQPRPGRARTCRRTPEHPRPRHLLRRWRGRLHRLPRPRSLTQAPAPEAISFLGRFGVRTAQPGSGEHALATRAVCRRVTTRSRPAALNPHSPHRTWTRPPSMTEDEATPGMGTPIEPTRGSSPKREKDAIGEVSDSP
ncbi:12-oxophytodienoate reductase [Actinobacteria bacterium OK074]|nr:12-oxophytodienoate reductase [Actinobacteria bacterium OK074]